MENNEAAVGGLEPALGAHITHRRPPFEPEEPLANPNGRTFAKTNRRSCLVNKRTGSGWTNNNVDRAYVVAGANERNGAAEWEKRVRSVRDQKKRTRKNTQESPYTHSYSVPQCPAPKSGAILPSMEQRSYGTLFVAIVIAVGAVALALFTTNTEPQKKESLVLVSSSRPAEIDTDGDAIPDWKEALIGTNPVSYDEALPAPETSVARYEAPSALPPAQAFAREFFAEYTKARGDGVITPEEAHAAIDAALIGRSDAAAGPLYELSDLSIEGDVLGAAYRSALIRALNRATEVREYELATFTRAVTEDARELEKLKDAAAVYAEIEASFVALEVPPSVAAEHLAALNSLGALTRATAALSNWGGDPLDALGLVNNFAAAEDDFSKHLAELFSLTQALIES